MSFVVGSCPAYAKNDHEGGNGNDGVPPGVLVSMEQHQENINRALEQQGFDPDHPSVAALQRYLEKQTEGRGLEPPEEEPPVVEPPTEEPPTDGTTDGTTDETADGTTDGTISTPDMNTLLDSAMNVS